MLLKQKYEFCFNLGYIYLLLPYLSIPVIHIFEMSTNHLGIWKILWARFYSTIDSKEHDNKEKDFLFLLNDEWPSRFPMQPPNVFRCWYPFCSWPGLFLLSVASGQLPIDRTLNLIIGFTWTVTALLPGHWNSRRTLSDKGTNVRFSCWLPASGIRLPLCEWGVVPNCRSSNKSSSSLGNLIQTCCWFGYILV